jgi:UDPglucose 6-dehydrogenase
LADITIVGAGVVGRATGAGLATRGHRVRFVDIDPAIIERLQASGLTASLPDETDFAASDLTLMCVNTPTVDGHIVIDHLMTALDTLSSGLSASTRPHTIVIRSTVTPGTTRAIIRDRIEAVSGRTVDGRDLGLATVPEFLRQARAADDFLHPWIHVVGSDEPETADRLEAILAPFGAPIVKTDPTSAETIKYAHNLFNATKISFFNELWLVCQTLGIDADVVSSTVVRSAEASWNPAYGSSGGFPYGGACLPKDTMAFLAFARSIGVEMPQLAGTIAINERLEEVTGGPGLPIFSRDMRPQPAPPAFVAIPVSAEPVLVNGNGNGHAKTNGVDRTNGHGPSNARNGSNGHHIADHGDGGAGSSDPAALAVSLGTTVSDEDRIEDGVKA